MFLDSISKKYRYRYLFSSDFNNLCLALDFLPEDIDEIKQKTYNLDNESDIEKSIALIIYDQILKNKKNPKKETHDKSRYYRRLSDYKGSSQVEFFYQVYIKDKNRWEDIRNKIEEHFDLEQEYDKWDDYSDCIDSDLEYKKYQQEQFRKEDSIEGPMSCFERGYYMDESSNSDYDERSFMEEYDFEDNLTFEMESEIYGSDFKSEMDDYGEEEYYQKKIAETDATEQEAQEREFKKQIAEMDAIERAQEREFEKQIAEYNAKNPIKK